MPGSNGCSTSTGVGGRPWRGQAGWCYVYFDDAPSRLGRFHDYPISTISTTRHLTQSLFLTLRSLSSSHLRAVNPKLTPTPATASYLAEATLQAPCSLPLHTCGQRRAATILLKI